MNEQEQVEFKKAAKEFLALIEEYLNVCLLLGDTEKVKRLTNIVNIQLAYEIVKGIREAGLNNALEALSEAVATKKVIQNV